MKLKLTRRATLIGLSACAAWPARAQTPPQSKSAPEATEAVSLEQRAIFDVAPITGTLKETVQKGQQLVWVAKGPNDRRFQITNVSVAFLRNEGDVKMTFAGEVSSLGYRPVDEAKLKRHCSHQEWCVDSRLEFWHFRQMRRQRPAACSAEPPGAERHRQQPLHKCRQRRNRGLQGAKSASNNGAALSLLDLRATLAVFRGDRPV
jgi:hypothetical protein